MKKILKTIKSILKFLEPPIWSPMKISPPPILTALKDEEMPFIKITPGEVFAKNLEAQKYAAEMQKLINKMLPQERLERIVAMYWSDLTIYGTSRPIQEYLKETEELNGNKNNEACGRTVS